MIKHCFILSNKLLYIQKNYNSNIFYFSYSLLLFQGFVVDLLEGGQGRGRGHGSPLPPLCPLPPHEQDGATVSSLIGTSPKDQYGI